MHLFEKLFGKEITQSSRNGTIVVRRWFGIPGIFVDGYDQSTSYIRTMWRKALRRVPRSGVKRVLMLGLCGGVGVQPIRRRFRGAALTVIDWDPEMIALFYRVNPRASSITIICGNAFVEMPKLTEQFDLVIVDLFKGKSPAPELTTDAAIACIGSVMAPRGRCVVNSFSTPEVLTAFDRTMMRKSTWRYRFNTLALYEKETK